MRTRPQPLKTDRVRGSCGFCWRWFPLRKDGMVPRHDEAADGGTPMGLCPGAQQRPHQTRVPRGPSEPAEEGGWRWGVHVVNIERPDDPEFQHDEWWDTEAEARKWLGTPRRGPVRLSLIRRRPAKPAGPVELVEEAPDDRP